MKVMTSDTGVLDLEVVRRRRLTSIIRKTAWLHWKATLLLWGLAMMFYPPTKVQAVLQNDVLGQTIHYTWTGMAVIGAAVSIVGISISYSPNPVVIRKRAVPTELTGLFIMFVGPLLYFTTQFGLLIGDLSDSFRDRFALTIYAWAMVAVVLARFCMVFPRFHKEG